MPIIQLIKKYKYIVIAFAAGIILLLLPRTSGGQARDAPLVTTVSMTALQNSGDSADAKLAAVLGKIDGARNLSVAVSDSGAIIVCGGLTPDLKLKLTLAASAYTGLSSEKIIILKGAEQ
ncbi:MAG: hypothetical protein LBD85_06975 [Oscillospiraceae bacterium]|nr:hypothetical protein [Oscillospiraceae bacterium]